MNGRVAKKFRKEVKAEVREKYQGAIKERAAQYDELIRSAALLVKPKERPRWVPEGIWYACMRVFVRIVVKDGERV